MRPSWFRPDMAGLREEGEGIASGGHGWAEFMHRMASGDGGEQWEAYRVATKKQVRSWIKQQKKHLLKEIKDKKRGETPEQWLRALLESRGVLLESREGEYAELEARLLKDMFGNKAYDPTLRFTDFTLGATKYPTALASS